MIRPPNARWWLGVAVAVACAALARPAAVAAKTPERPMESVQAKLAGREPGKPPMVTYLFDVTLRNAGPTPRWFLLPTWIEKPWSASRGGVFSAELYELRGGGRAVLARFLGSAGFQTVLVPAGGEVVLRRLPVSAWEERPAVGNVELEVVSGESLSIGGESAAAWFGAAAESDRKVDATADGRRVGGRATPDRGELPVTITDERRQRVRVPIVAPR